MFANSHVAHSWTLQQSLQQLYEAEPWKGHHNWYGLSGGTSFSNQMLSHSCQHFEWVKKTGIYPFHPSAVDDRQLAVSEKKTLSPQPVSEDDPVTSTEQPMLFSPEKEKLLHQGLKKTMTSKLLSLLHGSNVITLNAAYALQVTRVCQLLQMWIISHLLLRRMQLPHPSLEPWCLALKQLPVLNHSNFQYLKVSWVTFLPYLSRKKSLDEKESLVSIRKLCLTHDAVFDRFKAEDQEKKDKELEKHERKKLRRD